VAGAEVNTRGYAPKQRANRIKKDRDTVEDQAKLIRFNWDHGARAALAEAAPPAAEDLSIFYRMI